MDLLAERKKILSKLPTSFERTSKSERFLALALCGEAGELANFIKKRWRAGVKGRKGARDSLHLEQIRDEIADVRIYLELLAKLFDIEGEKLDQRVISKFKKTIRRHRRKR